MEKNLAKLSLSMLIGRWYHLIEPIFEIKRYAGE